MAASDTTAVGLELDKSFEENDEACSRLEMVLRLMGSSMLQVGDAMDEEGNEEDERNEDLDEIVVEAEEE